MKVVTSTQMRLVENRDIKDGRYNSQEYAILIATALQNTVIADDPEEVVVLCGENANGEYGLLLAYLLFKNSRIKTKVVYHGSKENSYYQLVIRNGIEVFEDPRIIKNTIENCRYAVDCLYGTELDEMISYPDNYIINWLNSSDCYVLSCDLPSGLDGNDGSLFGCCVRADKTMCIELPKLGLFLKPGSEYVGELIVEGVGISMDAINSVESRITLADNSSLTEMIRKQHQPKRVLYFAGSSYGSSAYLLTAKSLMSCGCDDLTVAGDRESCQMVGQNLYEVKRAVLDDEKLTEGLTELKMDECDLIIFSGGFKRNYPLLKEILATDRTVLIDHKAALELKGHEELLKRSASTVLICDQDVYDQLFFDESPANWLDKAQSLVREYPDLRIINYADYAILLSTSGISIAESWPVLNYKAGMKDVVLGALGSFLAQNKSDSSLSSALRLVYGAVKNYQKEHYSYSLSAGELIGLLEGELYSLSK